MEGIFAQAQKTPTNSYKGLLQRRSQSVQEYKIEDANAQTSQIFSPASTAHRRQTSHTNSVRSPSYTKSRSIPQKGRDNVSRLGFVGVLDAAIQYFEKPSLSLLQVSQPRSLEDSLEEDAKVANAKTASSTAKAEIEYLRNELQVKEQGNC
mmetsp:Transcript_11218/g.22072  ORF Transcript_11218/g.22072 Transcript_11218/m.22072 type:complete len:151 (-) Transcript_11218:967-1419(-)